MDPKIHEGGDSSDSELLDNWTIVDTDEAIDASLLADDEADNEEPEVADTDAPRPEKEESLEPEENCDSLKEDQDNNSITEDNNSIEAPLESDDGVSIITESDDEVEDLEPEVLANTDVPQSAAVVTEGGRISPGSVSLKSTSDLSDLSNQDIPLDLGQKGERQYVHHPNPKVNLTLNAILIIVLASVFGLGVGHFLGMHEECYIPKFGEVSEAPLSTETWTLLNSLSHENDLLKMQLKQLQNSLNGKRRNWSNGQMVMEPVLIKNEENVEWPPAEEVVEIEPAVIAEENTNNIETLVQTAEEPKVEVETKKTVPAAKQEFQAGSQYTDEQLENFQTRFAKTADEPRKPRSTKPDSFYNRVEAELQNVMQRVANYGSNLVKNRHIPNGVSTGLGVLTATISDLQQSVKTLSQNTAQQSTYMVDNVKKSISKMVQNVKHTTEKMTRGRPDGDVWKSLNKLKSSVVNGWCHIKGKLNKGNTQDCYSEYKKNDTKFYKPKQPENKDRFYPQENKYENNKACYKGKCSYGNKRYQDQYRPQNDWQFKRAQFREKGRQREVSDWYAKRVDARQQKRNYYDNERKWYHSRGH
ncbi:uncharacterized protein LOC132198749 [Neocloeon triangulifer]|uniref:uncharacterized protein LOC132198749 n=1 Tax=Neocloeon triangulifer TaxID=2078957 RepID=UPI00286F49CF|nr:uncharacterized protein LOC132198749 [Neocloeon triangulifer]